MMTKQVLYDSFTGPLSYLSITDCQSMENLGLQVYVRVGQPFYVQDKVQSICHKPLLLLKHYYSFLLLSILFIAWESLSHYVT